jgi:hypothetical protein
VCSTARKPLRDPSTWAALPGVSNRALRHPGGWTGPHLSQMTAQGVSKPLDAWQDEDVKGDSAGPRVALQLQLVLPDTVAE